jgi:1-acyl-sn-glycerol-3-phosphate acyltransferase
MSAMIDLDRLRKLRLHRTPPGQLAFANLVLRWDYTLPRRTAIELDGIEHIPRDRQVFLAMNHTDRYNYWPLQYAMYRRGWPFTATWVKGKYYDHPLMARFLDVTNNIPLPSRGYLLVAEFRKALQRKPADGEYRFLRDVLDGVVDPQTADLAAQSDDVRRFVGERGGSVEGFVGWFEALLLPMLREVVRLNRQAICELGLNVLVFPQGTRSLRQLRGHTGMVQMAQHLGAAIVPIGCNGSDHVYPGNSPLAKGGRIVYRIGKPLEPGGPELAPFRVTEAFDPLSRHAAERWGSQFRGATDVVTAHIDALLDPPYRSDPAALEAAVRAADRFL